MGGTDAEVACPDCGAPMVRRQAKRGPNAGGHFWGCSTYPDCKGTVSIDGPDADGGDDGRSLSDPDDLTHRPRVRWFDGTLRRDGWIVEHVPVGGGWRSFELPETASEFAETTWIAVSDVDAYEPADDDTLRVVSMVRKLLQRGSNAPLSPNSEARLLEHYGIPFEPAASGELAPTVTGRIDSHLDDARTVAADAGEVDPAIRYDSDEERLFHIDVLRDLLGPDAARWFLPQASLGELLRGRGADDIALFDARRVDFLAARPGATPFVVEIDGLQHRSQPVVDTDREQALSRIGIDTLRIPAAEIHAGYGPALDALRSRWANAGVADAASSALAPSQVQRAVLGMMTAVQYGYVLGNRWVIDLDDDLGTVAACLAEELSLLAAVDALWGPGVAPETIHLRSGNSALTLDRDGCSYTTRDADRDNLPPADVRLIIQSDRTPVEALPDPAGVPAVVLRPAILPVKVQLHSASTTRRVPVRTQGAATVEALRTVLRAIFAKQDFREGQLEAVVEVLEGRDAVVLLPTGAGKSLVYQLAGLLLPGVTLIVDPIIALMEDQIRGLASHGIDRVIGISSYLVQRGHGEEALARVGAGDVQFVFIAPERLQQPRFRAAITQMSATTMVNLAVADETHCVSEWGHDFRTAYLRLGSVLRRVCADAAGQPPPILALTGTASRAVLRDVLFELDIDAGASPNTLIRPRTFDRAELDFEIIVGDPDGSEARLKGFLQGLPGRMNRPAATFFQPNGHKTSSGIVFCPHVNGSYGIADVAELIQPVVGLRPALFSGKAPRRFGRNINWEAVKRANAGDFTSNRVPVLVATNSFGMGIDKPNIRWVVHYGMPSSIEAYYQEAGRAGRDGRQATCAIIYSELDEDRSRVLLDHDRDLESTRAEHQQVTWRDADDVTRALWFLLSSFAGVETNVRQLEEVIDEVADFTQRRNIELPFAGNKEERERAIHRLVLLGAVGDYTVDWGSKTFGLQVAKVTPTDVRDAVLGFVGRTQPARVPTLSDRLNPTGWEKPKEALLECGRALIEFVYDTIERSRRRSMREMWLAARQGDGHVLRQRILDYLTEGDAAPVMESLLDVDLFRYADWTTKLNEVLLVDDAAEWRGSSARLLVSEPDHPGLLLARAVTELRAPNGDLDEFSSNLVKSLVSARERYDVGLDELRELASWLSDRCATDEQLDARALVTLAFDKAGLRAEANRLAAAHARAPSCTAGDAVVHLSIALGSELDNLTDLVAAYTVRDAPTPHE